VTKPTKIAIGIGAAMLVCVVIAAVSGGVVRGLAAWTALACAVACGAYLRNRPQWLGKRQGAVSARAIVVLPYLLAFRVACRLMRWWRQVDRPTCVAPGVWVSGRIAALPPGVTTVVDLVAEYAAHPGTRRLPGYRCLPVLDGGVPSDVDAFLALVRELSVSDAADVLEHCDSGRGRAPTFAAALLVARGLAPDVARAVSVIRARRPVVALTRSDLAFLERIAPALESCRVRNPTTAAWAIDLEPPVR